MSELHLDSLQENIHQLCETIRALKQANQQLKNELEGSENVRRLLVRKNQHLADQVKNIINDLKATS